ncbi:MAG: NAD(+)/NADH kinase [Candidatus Diapherotrites archaeon]|nr:NAD(+)/NADH kinase [Candidatus Diapherotrites archaeon]
MPRIYLYGGSFNPPGLHHEAIVQKLASLLEEDDRLIVIPCGERPDKASTNDLAMIHRAAMCDLAFGKIPRVEINLTDLEQSVFSRTWDLDVRFRAQFPDHEIYHVIGTDLISGGAHGESEIQKFWFRGTDVWNMLHFLVQRRKDVVWNEADLPPHSIIIEPELNGSSSDIRERIFKHQPIKHLVSDAISAYIERHQLFTGRVTDGTALLHEPFRPIVIADDHNPKSLALQAQLQIAFPEQDGERNCIIVIGGDGFMLRTIRANWRKRLPFFGVNAGTVGFLLNDIAFADVIARLKSCRAFRTYAQQLLFVEYETTDGNIKTDIAFNDALVERTTTQTAWMRVVVNGEERYARMMGDGLLVATAAGSTGYARSMGATPIMIGSHMIVFAGSNICSHQWRGAQLSIHTEIQIDALETFKRPVRAVIDGRDCGLVRHMRVRTSNIASAELAFMPETDLALKISRLQF